MKNVNEIICTPNRNGITISYKNDKFRLIYPEKVWSQYPSEIKSVLTDNLAHLLTIDAPLIGKLQHVKYNTSAPFFRNAFYSMVMKSIPSSIESYDMNTHDVIREFMKTNYEFSDYDTKIPSFNQKTNDTAIVPLSFGKDSLATLAICKEIGLGVKPVYINDTISPGENAEKLARMKIFEDQFNLETTVITNEIEQLNDFDYWDQDESLLSYMHMVTGFCFISLPVSNYFKAKYIVIGNEKDMDFGFVNKDGFHTHPSPDQTYEWLLQQDAMIKLMTGNTGVISVIEPLTNIALMKILHTRYKEYGDFEISCDSLNASDEKRWCHECTKCARLFLFMKANNTDVTLIGFHTDLFQKKFKNCYALFEGKEVDNYESSKEARDQQLLAFYMAYKNGMSGDLINLFKKKFLDEAKEREDELYNFFFGIHKSHLPPKIKQAVESIYREELNKI